MPVTSLLLAAGGIALLLGGGEALVRGAVALARRVGLSPLVIGLTVVGFGTSAPELVVSVHAALSGSPGIALGNVVGSNVANILLIIGVSAVLYPLAVHRNALKRDGMVMLAATAVFILLALGGTIDAPRGAAMLALLALYLGWSLWSDRRDTAAAGLHQAEAAALDPALPLTGWTIAVALAAGLAGLVAGASLAVDGATGIARAAGVPDSVIGLTLVAVGTSLPELATAIVAARRGQADVCVGNVLGSNIFNLLGIGGAAALAAPLPMPPAMLAFDLWVMAAASLLVLAFMGTGQRVVRAEGVALLALYAAYVGWQFLGPPAAGP